ncbi:MAG: adenosylcobalamin-dependent ribonucleoside-diphosphate reductase, partial [bacterium]
NMGILRVDHPDILEFIAAKADHGRLRNFNLSVGITDAFMKAVAAEEMYELINPRTGETTERLPARMVFDLIAQSAWKNGEPGVIFLDRLNRDNPTPHLGLIESTNPCGEQPLLPYESCNLGSLNLARFVSNKEIDFPRLKEIIKLAVHFLDNVIDMNRYPLPQIEEVTKGNRKIGLGVMGFADMLVQLEIPYDSDEAIYTAEKVMSFIQGEAQKASENLAKERGPFPNFPHSIFAQRQENPRRNATLTTIAPTGTLSIIANCSSGIEPLYALVYERLALEKERFLVVNPYFQNISQQEGWFSAELLKKITQRGSLRSLAPGEVPEKWRKVFATAQDIAPEWHLRMQMAFQRYTDNAVSKTVNFPAHCAVADVAKVFQMAYQLGCKGVTVYVQGSRDEQVLQVPSSLAESRKPPRPPKEKSSSYFGFLKPRPRPEITHGQTHKLKTGCGSLYVTINKDEEGIFEVFALMGKSGGCAACQNETTGRLVSLALRSGVDVVSIMQQLQGIRCPVPIWDNGSLVLSCSDAISRALQKYLENSPGWSKEEKKFYFDGHLKHCPECGSTLEPESGCLICRLCGYSRCT